MIKAKLHKNSTMKKVCIVTGGSSGIGLSVCQLFEAKGYQVFNLDIKESSVGQFVYCDVSNVDNVEKAITEISSKHTIDALICSAGIHVSANIEATDEALLDKVFAINVKGAYVAIKASLPSMKKAEKGSIVLVSSDQAIIGKRNSFAYNLSKASLASMAKTTALDYAQFNIRANAVCPGTIETPLYHHAIDKYCAASGANKAEIHAEEEALQPLNRLGKPEEVAQLIYFLCSDHASFITGSLQTIDGGYTAQ